MTTDLRERPLARKRVAKKVASKRVAKKVAAKKTARKRTVTKRTVTNQRSSSAKRVSATRSKPVAKKATKRVATKRAATKRVAKKSVAKKRVATKRVAKRSTTQATARQTTARKPATRQTTARKTTARKTAARKTTARKTTASKTTARPKTVASNTTARRAAPRRTNGAPTVARPTRRPPQARTRRPASPTLADRLRSVGQWRPGQTVKLPATAVGERTGWSITILVIGLSLFGLVMVLSASSVASVSQDQSPFFTFSRQLRYAVIGGVAFAVGSRINYRRTDQLAVPAGIVAAVLLIAVLIPGVGTEINGSSRWLDLRFVVLQPAELAKLALIMMIAKILGAREHQMHLPHRTIRPVISMVIGYSILLMLQPKLGTPIIMATVALLMLFSAKARLDHLIMWSITGVAGAAILGYVAEYRRRRLLAVLDPWAYADSIGLQTVQSQIGIASGGVFGRGLGGSRAKWGFLPEAQTDFIFAVVGEELGVIGAFALILAFGLFGYLGLTAALRAPDAYGRILASGLTIWIITQASLNIGMALGLMPITGEPLPFVSAGGSSLVTTLFASGLLVSVARRGRA